MRDLKELEHQLVENGAKYDALMEVNKSQAEAFKAQMQSRTIRLKELDVVVVRMSQEIETLKDQLTEQKSAHAVIAHQLETEKRVSNGLKSEMIKIEGQHNEEIQKLKDKIEEQIAETMKQLSTPTVVHLFLTSKHVFLGNGGSFDRSSQKHVSRNRSRRLSTTQRQRSRYR